MEFSRPEYWGGLPFPFPGDLPNPGIEPRSPALQVDSLPTEPQGKPKNTGVGSLPFSRGSARPRDRAQVSHIAGGFFTSWATGEGRRELNVDGAECPPGRVWLSWRDEAALGGEGGGSQDGRRGDTPGSCVDSLLSTFNAQPRDPSRTCRIIFDSFPPPRSDLICYSFYRYFFESLLLAWHSFTSFTLTPNTSLPWFCLKANHRFLNASCEPEPPCWAADNILSVNPQPIHKGGIIEILILQTGLLGISKTPGPAQQHMMS